jgi:NAD(P)-dependent dehydrogenase (short-subunit alcohol dehydrogenase family)
VNWELDGHTALVTGAGGSIGSAICRHLTAAGATVYAADLEWAQPSADAARSLTLDVTDRRSVATALDEIANAEGGLDIAVNNAGTMRARADLGEYDREDWDFVFDVNAAGVFTCLQEEARIMGAAGRGAIVNLASVAGRQGRTYSPPYAASKAAVISLTRTVSLLLAPKGVRVNAICPGLIESEFNLRLGRQFGPDLGISPEEFVERRAEGIPAGRIGTVDDVARAVCFLASPASDYIVGQAINVDGGLVLS